MNVLTSLLGLLKALFLAIVLHGWQAIAPLLVKLWAVIRRCLRRKRLTHNRKNRNPGDCTPIHRPEFKRPDPLIYSQNYLMSLGIAVTWDNPDITLEKATGPLQPNAPPNPSLTVPSSALQSDTEYDVIARVWNGSTSAPAVGLPVRFRFFGFGIGTQGQAIGDASTNLGVKGGVSCPAFARARWRTPAVPGHYCIQAHLDWFDDLNPANNLGQENTNVAVAASPAKTTFRLRNAREMRQRIRLTADSYVLAPLRACATIDRKQERRFLDNRRRDLLDARQPAIAGRPETFAAPSIPPQHVLGKHPLPLGWGIQMIPELPDLAGGEEIDVEVIITPPAGFTGRQAINVHAFDSHGPIGGVTLYVEKP